MRINLLFIPILLAVLSNDSRGLAPVPKDLTPPLNFAAAVNAPNYNDRTNEYNFFGHGNFEKEPAPLWIRLTLRETALVGSEVNTFKAPLITEDNPAPQGYQSGILRTPLKPQTGSFLGYVSSKRYDTDAFKYEIKIEIVNAKGKVTSTYRENDSEWIPIPKPKS